MALAVIDGIETRYEAIGSGPPLQMYAPGGFNAAFAKQDRDQYKSICEATCRALFDRDTAPGAEPEELIRTIGICRWNGRPRTRPTRASLNFWLRSTARLRA
jgi:hypothetical protein